MSSDHPYPPDEADATWKSISGTVPRDVPYGVNGHIPHSGEDGMIAGRAVWNAHYFAHRYRDRLRYVAQTNRWYECNGKWWEPDEVKVATRLGIEAVDALYQQAVDETDRAKKGDYAVLAKSLDDSKKINAMITQGAALAPLAVTADHFDREDWHLVVANGIIDLRTGALLPHKPSAMHSHHTGPTLSSIEYDPDATCPHYEEFLRVIFPEQDGPDMIGYLGRMAGYTSSGSIQEQCMFILTGEGENGKSTLSDTMQGLFGSYSDTLPPESLLATHADRHPADLAKLVGKRGVFVNESERGRRLAEARIKQMTERTITARFMRQDFFTFDTKFKLWLHTNAAPKLRGTDRGIRRRLRVIPFWHTITEAEKIKDYYEKYLRPELPGILAWAVRGALDWQRRGGLDEPERVRKATSVYIESADVLGQYLAEYVYRAEGAFLPSATLYRAYADWCRQQNEEVESQGAVSRAVHATFGVEPTVAYGEGRGFRDLAVQDGRTAPEAGFTVVEE